MADWAGERVGLHFIPPGQAWRNGYIESFNFTSRIRDECLNINIFWSLAHARVVISDSRLQPSETAQCPGLSDSHPRPMPPPAHTDNGPSRCRPDLARNIPPTGGR